MEDAIAEIQFLANSSNRLRVLAAVADGATTRREVEMETGVARSTVARALDEAEDRHWVDSEGSRYWVTPSGEVRLTAFRSYLARTEGMQHLDDAFEWLPDPLYDLDFRHLRDADLTYPTPDNPTAPHDRALALLREADTYRSLTENAPPEYMRLTRDRVAEGGLTFEGVVERSFVESLTDPDRLTVWRDVAHRTWLYDGDVPLNLQVADDTALVWLCGEGPDGTETLVQGLLESDEPAVVSWASSLFEKFRAEAESLEPTEFATV
jgi:predicted transcriptional regulator